MARNPSRVPPLLAALSDDLLILILEYLVEEHPRRGDTGLVSGVHLGSVNHELRKRLEEPLAAARLSLPPPYSATDLDAALSSGDPARATPLLREAMRRVKHNVELIASRLLSKGFPVAVDCAASGRPYMTGMGAEAVEQHAGGLHERGGRIPLALQIFWEELGGVALASADGSHNDWWAAMHPEVIEEAGTMFAPDPLWLDHGVEVLRHAAEEQAQPPVTLPVGFSDTDGFIFREGHVLHLAPDALAKRQPTVASAAAAAGSYACWLVETPDLDPELLRFTPPEGVELGGAEPLLWRAQCSLIAYLRIAVLEGGGFPGCLGLEHYEPLRRELTDGLKPF